MSNLILASNRISSFQTSENNNQTLRSLNLINNRLKAFPNDILNLKDLRSCHLRDNDIATFDLSNTSEHQSLATIDLYDNNLQEVIGIEKLIGLQDLNLSANLFRTFPTNTLYLKRLKSLDLSNNKINQVGNIDSLNTSSLENLNLTGNEFITLPKSLLQLEHLIGVDLSNNKIRGKVNLGNTNVVYLNLSANNITSVYVGKQNKIQKLSLQHNNLNSFSFEEGALQYLEVLDLSNNPNLKEFPFEIFSAAPNLKTIDIIDCKGLSKTTIEQFVKLAKKNSINYMITGDVNYRN